MSQSIHEPIAFATMPAGVAALMRWYPNVPRKTFDALRRERPGYPLIGGGRVVFAAPGAQAVQ